MLAKIFSRALEIIRRRILFVLLILGMGFILLEIPNAITHQCVPDVRTTLGLSSDGYPSYDRHYCEKGYHPELKWGLDEKINLSIAELFMILPLLIIIILLLYMLFTRRLPTELLFKLFNITDRPNKPYGPYKMKVVSDVDAKIAETRKRQKSTRPKS